MYLNNFFLYAKNLIFFSIAEINLHYKYFKVLLNYKRFEEYNGFAIV